MTRIAELQDRLRRLAKRREAEGIYTDAAICEEAAKTLSRTGAVKVKALDEDDYEEIISAAAINMRKSTSGTRGQVITVQDSIDWWVMKETERRVLSALEPAAPEGRQEAAEADRIRREMEEILRRQSERDIPFAPATRPAEQAVTDEMVGAAEEVFFKTDDHGEPSYDMRAALKAAMEAGR